MPKRINIEATPFLFAQGFGVPLIGTSATILMVMMTVVNRVKALV